MRPALLFFLLFIAICAKVIGQNSNSSVQPTVNNRIWVGASFGPSLLLEKAPDSLIPQVQDFFNKLRSGWAFGFESQYFFNQYIGAGAKYSRFNTKLSVDSMAIQFLTNTLYINVSNNMRMHTLTPMAYGKIPLMKNKITVSGGVGPAWLIYRNIGQSSIDSATIKGSSPGLSTSLSVSYQILPNIHLGLHGTYIRAFLKEYTKENGSQVKLEEQDYQNLSRIDLSFGVFYTFWRKKDNLR
ncbi:MAG: hypothetical protein ACOYN4_03135 [Bacteroidales bacterium]